MFTKENLPASLAGFIVMFLLGYAIWGFATEDFFDGHTLKNVMKETPDMLFIALGNLIGAFALSSLYGKWAKGVHSAKEGFQFGIWVGIFTGFGMGLLNYGVSEIMDLTGYIAEGIIEIIFYGIIGAVIALVYKATATKSS
ncbi:MAG: hypothetical protein KJO52_04810 [Maribacter sp.]|nr:hypothetical protein [Maribacter sp.]